MAQPPPSSTVGPTLQRGLSRFCAGLAGGPASLFYPTSPGGPPAEVYLRRSEKLSLLSLAVLVVLTLVGRPASVAGPIASFAALAAAVLVVARLGRGSWIWVLTRDFFPVVVIVVVFGALEPIIAAVNPTRWDATFAAVDARYFSGLVESWRGFLGRPARLTDGVYLAYLSYYVLPIVVGVAIRLHRSSAEFEETAFIVLASFYTCYLGYFLFPTSGPRLSDAESVLLGGGAISEASRAFLRAAEGNHLDAFPSGHTGVSLVTLAVGWRLLPRWRVWLVAWAGAIVFATVYIHVHYVIDVVVGTAVALAVLLLEVPAVRQCARSVEPGSLAAP
jgi:membrane-associated phospholipid phosphatase